MRMCLIVGFKHMEIPKLGNLSNFEIFGIGKLGNLACRQAGWETKFQNESEQFNGRNLLYLKIALGCRDIHLGFLP